MNTMKRPRLSKLMLLNAARNSSSIEEFSARLGRDHNTEGEEVWEKLMKKVEDAAYFIERNEAIKGMKLANMEGNLEDVKMYRLQYIGSTMKLMDAGLMQNKPDRQVMNDFLTSLALSEKG